MWFIFGMMVGAGMASGGSGTSPAMQAMLSQIPLRCFAALDESDVAYKSCRMLSMRAEMFGQADRATGRTNWCGYVWDRSKDKDLDYWRPHCAIDDHLTLEVKALRAIEAEVKKVAEKR